MVVRIIFRVVSLLLHAILSFAEAFTVVKYQEKNSKGSVYIEEQSFTSCTCFGETTKEIIPKNERLEIYEKFRNPHFCEENDKRQICVLYGRCKNCSFHMTECQPNAQFLNKYDCQTKTAIRYENHERNAMQNDSTVPRRRYSRQTQYCALPQESETFDTVCRTYTTHICQQLCIFGYTLRKGVEVRRRCTFKENKWKPTGFKECLPFIDCKLQLTGIGTLNCTTASTTEAPTCNVTCEASNAKVAVQNLRCTITGEWDQELPFCVASKPSKKVPAPNINFHPYASDFMKFAEDKD